MNAVVAAVKAASRVPPSRGGGGALAQAVRGLPASDAVHRLTQVLPQESALRLIRPDTSFRVGRIRVMHAPIALEDGTSIRGTSPRHSPT